MKTNEDSEICIKSIDQLPSKEAQNIAAELVYLSLPEFYDSLALPQSMLLERIVTDALRLKTELEHHLTLVCSNSVVGFASWYASDEMQLRQMISLKNLLGNQPLTPALIAKLKQLQTTIAPTPENSLYLSRIAVLPQEQRKGYGTFLLEHFEDHAISAAQNTCLHVSASNQSALDFYKRFGYSLASEGDWAYLALCKSIKRNSHGHPTA